MSRLAGKGHQLAQAQHMHLRSMWMLFVLLILMQAGCACLQTCSKQYKNAAEMEAHLSSYDHHHKKVGIGNYTVCTRLDKKGIDV